jgi:hypothetical protein
MAKRLIKKALIKARIVTIRADVERYKRYVEAANRAAEGGENVSSLSDWCRMVLDRAVEVVRD